MVAKNVLHLGFLCCIAAAVVRPQAPVENQVQEYAEDDVRSKSREGEATRLPKNTRLIDKLKRAVENGEVEKKQSGKMTEEFTEESYRGRTPKNATEMNPSVLFNLVMESAIDYPRPSHEGDREQEMSSMNSTVRAKKSSIYYGLPQEMSVHDVPPQGPSVEIRPQSCLYTLPYTIATNQHPLLQTNSQPLMQSFNQGPTSAATLSLIQPAVKITEKDGQHVFLTDPGIGSTTRAAQNFLNNAPLGYCVPSDANQRWGPIILVCQTPLPYPPQKNCALQLLAADKTLTTGFLKSADGDVRPSTSVDDVAGAAVQQLVKEANLELAGAIAEDKGGLPWPAPLTPEDMRRQEEAMLANQAALVAQQQQRVQQWLRLNQMMMELQKKVLSEAVTAAPVVGNQMQASLGPGKPTDGATTVRQQARTLGFVPAPVSTLTSDLGSYMSLEPTQVVIQPNRLPPIPLQPIIAISSA